MKTRYSLGIFGVITVIIIISIIFCMQFLGGEQETDYLAEESVPIDIEAKTETNYINPESEPINTFQDRSPATSGLERETNPVSPPYMDMSVSPTVGLEELIESYEQEMIRDMDLMIGIEEMRQKWLDWKSRGETRWNSEEWMKPREYYKNLDTFELVEECFSRPALFGFEIGLYDLPEMGYNSLAVFHNGFSELFEREDLWRGLVHAYEVLSAKIDPESDLKTIVLTSIDLVGLNRLYGISPFKEQIHGHEQEFLEATYKTLVRYQIHIHDFFNKKSSAADAGSNSLGYFGEATGVARVALLMAKQVDPSKYAQILPAIESVRFSREQNYEQLRNYIDIVVVRLKEFVDG